MTTITKSSIPPIGDGTVYGVGDDLPPRGVPEEKPDGWKVGIKIKTKPGWLKRLWKQLTGKER